ncbi:hypothetical protein F4694_002415 [Bacillus niacini]|jgi:hypothetical protein|uniref:Uncharacterized protein n=1 Tax=Neobacillus niacini TaxID=86668 RepID=A0A852TA45_9BACI|nr:hypothetical protein [Neobacillus niacini]
MVNIKLHPKKTATIGFTFLKLITTNAKKISEININNKVSIPKSKPQDLHLNNVNAMLDQVIAWSGALKTLR